MRGVVLTTIGFRYSVFTVMTPELSVNEVATTLRSIGYEGVELRVANLLEKIETIDFWRGNRATVDASRLIEEAPKIKKLSDENGLSIPALGTYLSADDMAGIERAMKAAKVMGCTQIRVSVPRYDGTRNCNELFKETIGRFADIEDLARRYKVRANIEIHHGTMCPSASSIYRLVANFDPQCIGVIYDPGNMIHEGYENWQMGLELLGSYLAHVHVKNARWEFSSLKGEVEKWRPVMCGLGEGFVDWREVLLALRKVNYEGWLSFEDFSKGNTIAKLRSNLEYMKDLERSLV